MTPQWIINYSLKTPPVASNLLFRPASSIRLRLTGYKDLERLTSGLGQQGKDEASHKGGAIAWKLSVHPEYLAELARTIQNGQNTEIGELD